jgi:hypothetical protein
MRTGFVNLTVVLAVISAGNGTFGDCRTQSKCGEAHNAGSVGTRLPSVILNFFGNGLKSRLGGQIVAMMQTAKSWHGYNEAICI